MERAIIERRTAVRMALAAAAAIVFRVGTPRNGSAKIIKTNTPIASRVLGQSDNCMVDGGTLQVTTFTQPKRPPGQQTVRTVCKGGASNGYTCTNTPKATSCGYPD